MNRIFTLLIVLFTAPVFAQQSGTITVGGDFDKFYPVTFTDAGWGQYLATELEIGRSDVHQNSDWRGAMISKFRFHNTLWGNGAKFIDANIMQFNNVLGVPSVTHRAFIAGWRDASYANTSLKLIIWLRGGGTTYAFKSPFTVNPSVYDGVQNALPYLEENGPAHSYKTSVDIGVNSNGLSSENTAFYLSEGNNYFAGNVGIGTYSPDEKLTVNGKIHAKEVRIDATVPVPDYVLKKDYELPTLAETERYVNMYSHLPGVPSATEMESKGINVNEMQMLLLKKVEELTLHLIDKEKQITEQSKVLQAQGKKIKGLTRNVNLLLRAKAKR